MSSQKHDRTNSSFERSVLKWSKIYEAIFTSALDARGDRTPASALSSGLKRCKETLDTAMLKFCEHKGADNAIIAGVCRRYRDYVTTHYASGASRFSEWYDADWINYLNTEHSRVVANRDLHPDLPEVMSLSLQRCDVKEILACRVAFDEVTHRYELERSQLLSPSEDESDEPYETEHANQRRKGSYSRAQATALIVALVYELTSQEPNPLEQHPDPEHLGYYNVKVQSFAELISKITGLSYHNTRKDVSTLRQKKAIGDVDDLKKILSDFDDLGFRFQLRLLQEIIAKH